MNTVFKPEFALNQVLIDDVLAFRIAGLRTNDDGRVDNPALGCGDFDANELELIRAKLRFNPTDDLEFIISYADQNTSQGEARIDADAFPDQRINT